MRRVSRPMFQHALQRNLVFDPSSIVAVEKCARLRLMGMTSNKQKWAECTQWQKVGFFTIDMGGPDTLVDHSQSKHHRHCQSGTRNLVGYQCAKSPRKRDLDRGFKIKQGENE